MVIQNNVFMIFDNKGIEKCIGSICFPKTMNNKRLQDPEGENERLKK